jgi:regulation of enolase protein 1 (concanavalin A-like superfamily)
MSVPSAGTVLTIPSLATGSTLLAGTITNVSMLGSASALAWSQTSTGLVVTCPATMPAIPAGTAICFKVGPASAIGTTIPTGVIALPGTNRISLAWDYPSTAATFNVKRSTTQGGSYTTIATNLTSLAFADTNVSPATLYFYVVTAVDAGGESVNSAETSASLAGAPSGNWLTEDVGAVGAAGSFNLSEGTFTVQGSGNDIWETADEFRYVFQALNGDCAITARVLNMQNTAGWAKAGLMIRETLDPASKYVINFMSPVNGTALQQRQATGGSASGVSNNTGRAAPYWLRLVRTNDTFTAFISADGTNWIQSGTTTVAMNACVYVGPAVCSHNDGTLCQAQFDNVTFSTAAYRPIAAPLPPLIHRYSFNETSGTNATDSVGGLTATLRGGASFDGAGKVVLNGTNSYVNLGGGLLSGLTSATFEGWFSYAIPNNNVHLFSFDDGTGTGTQNGGAWNGNYIRYNINNGIATVEIPNKGNPYNTGNAGDGKVAGATTLSQNTLHHVVFVYDSASGVESLYLDGVLDGTASGTVAPINSIFNTRGTLGASPWSAWGDPYLKGAISEFRIYSGALSQSDISTSHMVGQDVLLTTNVTLNVSQGGGGITFSWPVAASGFTLESSPTLGSGAVWTPVDGASQIIGSNNQVTVPATNAAMFFRLLR